MAKRATSILLGRSSAGDGPTRPNSGWPKERGSSCWRRKQCRIFRSLPDWVRARRVSKWQTRFARQRLAGLADEARPGKPRRYNAATEKRILQKLDEAPPSGHATWTGQLLAKALGKVSAQQVWRVLRRRGISLRRRRSWFVSTDPESLWGCIWRPRLVLGASNG